MSTIVTDGAAQPGPTGATGSTGATGNGAVFTSVDSLHATPRSVTDWGAVINTALAAGTRRFVFGPFDYPYTTTIDGSHLQGIVFQGAEGWDWYDPGRTDGNGKDTGHTRLIWNGTGSGITIDLTSTTTGPNGNTGPVLEDIGFLYSSGSFTGTLVDMKLTTMAHVSGCFFDGVWSTTTGPDHSTAAAALAVGDANTVIVENSTFGPGFLSSVRGRESTRGFSNVITFRDCTFEGGVNAMITNPGLDWLLDGCDFEFPSLAAGVPAITTDFTYTGDQVQLTLRNCEFWDAPATGQQVVSAPAGNDWTFLADQCIDHATEGGFSKLYDFQGTGSIRITGGIVLNTIDFGDAGASSTHLKNLVVVIGMSVGVASGDQFLHLDTGHTNVCVLGNEHGPNYNGVLRDGRVRLDSVSTRTQVSGARPTIAAHAGITGITASMLGSEFAGIIVLQNTSGSSSATGLIADVTMSYPPANKGPTNNYVFPIVVLGAYEASSDVTPGSAGAQSAFCHQYAHTVGGTLGSFSVGVGTAIPAGAFVCYSYIAVNLNGAG